MFSPSEPLDDQQRRAVTATDGRIAVLAGPGSGKTRTLCQRARFLLEGDSAGRCLLLTFGNRAAAEIKGRAARPGDLPGDRLFAGTYHAFGATILRSHGHRFDIRADYEIVDSDEAREIATEVADEQSLSQQYDAWSGLRSSGLDPPTATVAEFGAAYEAAKREMGVVDFADLIVYPARLFAEEPALAEAYALRYPHLLVDEFQDTTELQLSILLAMAHHCQTVSVFADDDQAVLSFIGARAEYVWQLIEDLSARVFVLSRNYRCREEIVRCANRLMAADPASSGRGMKAVYPGGSVAVRTFETQQEEARALAEEITSVVALGTPPSGVGVLALSRPRLGPLLSALRERELAVVDWLGDVHSAPARRLAKLLLALVLGRLSDRQALRLCALLDVEDLGERGCDAFVAQMPPSPVKDGLVETRRLANSGARASDVLNAISGVVAVVAPDQQGAVDRVVAELRLTEHHDPGRSLDHLLSDLSLGGSAATPAEAAGIKVATLQGTKGLEWEHVYLVGLEQGLLPFYKSTSGPELSEQRRICYVGVTRAALHLTLSRVLRNQYGYWQTPSQFLGEMGL